MLVFALILFATACSGRNDVTVETVQEVLELDVQRELNRTSHDDATAVERAKAFIDTQIVLIKSQFVFKAVLSRQRIKELTVVKNQPDPWIWLDDSLKVENPPGTNQLIITLRSQGDVKELKEVLESIIEISQYEVVAR